jgi:HK97 family phage prohead protease
MTDQLGYIGGGSIAVRDDAGGDGRTVHGYAYRWGELTPLGAAEEYPGMAEGFARGAFTDAIAARGERPWPMLDRHFGTPVGAIRFMEDEVGLRYEGKLLGTQAAKDYAESIPAGNDGVSLEFIRRNLVTTRQGRTLIHSKVPLLAALAGTYAGAYAGATVALRQDGGSMEPTTTTVEAPPVATTEAPVGVVAGPVPLTRDQVAAIAQDVTTEAMRAYAERGPKLGQPDPLDQYASVGDVFRAVARGEVPEEQRAYAARAIARRALDNSVFTAGANAGLASGNLVRQDIAGIVNRGRPAITAFGGPRPLGDTAGLTLEWPYFDGTLTDFVGAQSAEKAEVTSASMDIKLATEALVTYAGGSDLSYQLIRRGSPSALDAFARIILAAWAAVTDAAFVTELETGTATIDFAEALSAHDLSEFIANLIDGSVTIEAATGRPAEFALLSTTAFAQYAKLAAAASTQTVLSPDFSMTGLNLGIGGLRLIHDPNVTAGKVIISNSLAAAWYEDGPFQATSEDAPKLGRDVVYWSLGAGARLIPAGILEAYDVTP